MATKKVQRAGKRKMRRSRQTTPRQLGDTSNEAKLLRLIMDPCGADVTNGYALSTKGVVQRYTTIFTPSATDTNLAYYINPCDYSGTAIREFKAANFTDGMATPGTAPLPGAATLDASADAITTLAACVQVMYKGKLLDRSGYLGAGQGSGVALNDMFVNGATPSTTFAQALNTAQAVAPMPSNTVEVKWSPSVANFNGAQGISEASIGLDQNSMFVVITGVPANQVIVKVTVVYEWLPKGTSGLPLPSVGRVVTPGTAERITTALNRAGYWWTNLMHVADAAGRMAGYSAYSANQAMKFVSANPKMLGGAATALLALAG